jgi:hypothetical protein
VPLQRNEFLPQDLVTVYTSPSGLIDTRTGYPYQMGGLIVGGYFDLTEFEAQNYGRNQLHSGRYRFVQIDSGATAANIVLGSIGLMKAIASGQPNYTGGVNIITSYDKGLAGNVRPVVFLAPITAAQVTAGAWVFVQEEGDATVLSAAGGVTNATPAVGDVINSVAGGLAQDLASPGSIIPTSIGYALSAPSHTVQGTFRVLLDLPVIQG